MRRCATGALVLMACVLAACGGGDDDAAKPSGAAAEQRAAAQPQDSEEKQVRAVMVEALTTKDPAACTRLLTQAVVEQLSFQRGKKAIAQCREDSDDVGAKSVSVQRVEVDGARAEVDVEPEGGTLTLKTATFRLIKDGRRWKVDRLTAGTLDRPAFFREARREFSEDSDMTQADADCIVDSLRPRKDAELMRIYLNGDPRVIIVPTLVCAIRSELPRTPQAAAFGRCVTQAAERELTTGMLGRELAQDADIAILETERFQQVIGSIVARCAGRARPGSSAGGVS